MAINIEGNLNAVELSERLSFLAAEKILDNLDKILDDKIKFNDQNHQNATYAKKINKLEGKINWNDTAESIVGKINGLFPSPGAWFIFNGERFKILKAEVGNRTGKVGEVLNENLEVACGNSKSIKILEIQKEGKKSKNINEFILGSQIKKGSIINNV